MKPAETGSAAFEHGSKVRCHSCGRQMRLEEARPRGGLWRGFICPDCFGSQARTAFVVVALIGLVLIVFLVGSRNTRSRSEAQDSVIPRGIPSGNVYLEEAGLETSISEIHAGAVNIYLPTDGFEKTWRSRLISPLTVEKLNLANFAYGSDLLSPASEGSVVSESLERINIVVRAPGNLYFRVEQDRKQK